MSKENERQRTMTVGTTVTPFGCCNFFDHCTDELMSLHFSGALGLLDWMGWNVSDECLKVAEFITYVGPEGNMAGTPTAGNITDPCSDPHGFEFCSCKLTTEDFGLYGRTGPVREIMKPRLYCATDPRRRLDGTLVTSEFEWDIRFAMDTLLMDLRRDAVTGNFASGTNQIDGLERWVRTGYDCESLDAVVVDWNGNPMTGGAGITWNGNAIGAAYDIIQVLLSGFRRIRQRASWARSLQNQTPNVGDVILVLPTHMIDCLLDFFTCWTVCPSSTNLTATLMTYEARTFRNSLLGGMFGFGQISLDGFTIPLLAWDWGLIKSPTLSDMYFLARSWGSQRVWECEHLSAQIGMQQLSEGNAQAGYFTLDGNRILGRTDTENLCRESKIWMFPRTFCRAPWMQIRFQDVQCAGVFGPLSPDPLDTSFVVEGSCSPGSC